jgi:hypothetical protein
MNFRLHLRLQAALRDGTLKLGQQAKHSLQVDVFSAQNQVEFGPGVSP